MRKDPERWARLGDGEIAPSTQTVYAARQAYLNAVVALYPDVLDELWDAYRGNDPLQPFGAWVTRWRMDRAWALDVVRLTLLDWDSNGRRGKRFVFPEPPPAKPDFVTSPFHVKGWQINRERVLAFRSRVLLALEDYVQATRQSAYAAGWRQPLRRDLAQFRRLVRYQFDETLPNFVEMAQSVATHSGQSVKSRRDDIEREIKALAALIDVPLRKSQKGRPRISTRRPSREFARQLLATARQFGIQVDPKPLRPK